MQKQAKGAFEVQPTPQPPYAKTLGASLGRSTFSKQFSGELEATSTVEMLAATSNIKGSAGYVAMEIVEGVLHGKKGSFILQHSATMERGKPHLVISVVPDTGAGELKGLQGTFHIDITHGQHAYVFDYSLDTTASV